MKYTTTLEDVVELSRKALLDRGTTQGEKLTKKISKHIDDLYPSPSKTETKLRTKKSPDLLLEDLLAEILQVLSNLSNSASVKSVKNLGLNPNTKTFQGYLLSGNTAVIKEDTVLELQKAKRILKDPTVDELTKIVTAAYLTKTPLPEEFVKDLNGIITGTNFRKNGSYGKTSVYWKSAQIADLKKLELLQCFDTIKTGEYVLDLKTCDRLLKNGQSIKVNNEDILPALRSLFNHDAPRILDYHTKYGLDLDAVTEKEYEDLEKYGIIPDRFKLHTLPDDILYPYGVNADKLAPIWRRGQEEYLRLAVRRNYLLKTLFPGSLVHFATEYLTPKVVLETENEVARVAPSTKTSYKYFRDTSGKNYRFKKLEYYQTDEFGNKIKDEFGDYTYGPTSSLAPRRTVFTVDGYNTNFSALNPTPNRKISNKTLQEAEKELTRIAELNPDFFREYTKALRLGDFTTLYNLIKSNPLYQLVANKITKVLSKFDNAEIASMFAGLIHHLDELSMLAIPLLIDNGFDVQKAISKYPEKRKTFEYLRDMVLLPLLLHTGPGYSAHNFQGILPTSRLGEVTGLIRLGGLEGMTPKQLALRILDNSQKGKDEALLGFFEKQKNLLELRRTYAGTLKRLAERLLQMIDAADEALASYKRTDTKKYREKKATRDRNKARLDNKTLDWLDYISKTNQLREDATAGIYSHFGGDNLLAVDFINQLLKAKRGAKLIPKHSFGSSLMRELVPKASKITGKTERQLIKELAQGTLSEEQLVKLSKNTSNLLHPGGAPVAAEYLLTGNPGTIKSTGYFLTGISGIFPNAVKDIEKSILKHLEVLKNSGDINSFMSNPKYKEIMSDIKLAIINNYGEQGAKAFDIISSSPTGLYSKQGQIVSQLVGFGY